jgi:hypothetical protein
VWAVSAGGCAAVGDGSGSAAGPLWILGCEEGHPYMGGSPDNPRPYELEPTFFAGEPIGDISVIPGEEPSAPQQNRLIIRMQRTGNAVEINDTLYFDIPSSYQVARCIRGALTPTGEPDWDTGTGTVNPDPAYANPWCEQNGPNGVPRIHMVPFGPVRASLAPLQTCHMTSPGPTVVSVTAVAMDGWIEFEHFGGAAQPSVPVADRKPVGFDFQVAYDQSLTATFDLVLDDDRRQTAIYKMIDVPPAARIGGTLAGFFDFDLKRGRTGQTFP